MPSLAELRENIAAKRSFLGQIQEQFGPEVDLAKVDLLEGDTARKAAQIQQINLELNDLSTQRDQLENLENIAKNNRLESGKAGTVDPAPWFGGGNGAPASGAHAAMQKGLRGYLTEHKSYQAFRSNGSSTATIEIPTVQSFKALLTLTTATPQPVRRPDNVDLALEERTIIDMMLQGQVDRGVVEYYEETAFTNNATMTAEGVAKTESDMTFTLRSDTVRKVAHWLQATKEALDDIAFLETQMRGRLAFGVTRKEEQQVLSGDGTGQNILGILNRSGIQTQAVGGATTNMDAIYLAMQKIRGSAGAGFAEPTGLVVHPSNWSTIKLTKTTDGIYLYGAPADEGVDRIWGLMVRQTTAITAGTALVGAFRPHAEVLRREGINIVMSTEHASFVIENKVALVGESRLGLAVYRPSAFATVTAMT